MFILLFSYFILNKRTGFLIIKENAPPGTYQFQVCVADGVWPDAVSTVTVHVRELRDEAIYNSGSIRLAGKVDLQHAETHKHTHTLPLCLIKIASCITGECLPLSFLLLLFTDSQFVAFNLFPVCVVSAMVYFRIQLMLSLVQDPCFLVSDVESPTAVE